MSGVAGKVKCFLILKTLQFSYVPGESWVVSVLDYLSESVYKSITGELILFALINIVSKGFVVVPKYFLSPQMSPVLILSLSAI